MNDHKNTIGTKLVYTSQRVPALVTVTDARNAYGRTDYQILDVLGRKTWVRAESCEAAPKEEV